MVDNKLNMSLDEIIKKERLAKQKQQSSKQGGGKRRLPVTRRNIKGNRSATVFPSLRKNRAQGSGDLAAAAAMRVVNNLVKRAIQQRANQSLINRAATLRRRAVRRSVAVRPAVTRFRARRRAAVPGSRLAGRLMGLSQRSRVIAGNATRRARRQQQVILASPQVVRGRGISRMGQLISDDEAVVMEQREIARPVRQQQVLRRVAASRPRREVIVQSRTRPVIVDQRPVIVRRGGIRKQVVLNSQPDVVVVRNTPPRRAQFRAQPVFERIQRVVNVQPRKRFIQRERRTQFVTVNPNAAQFRKALGIGVQRSEPERFESSSTFLQRVPVTNRRGRGFQTVVYE